MITSSCALVIALIIIVLGGFSKVVLPRFPYDAMVTAVVALTSAYITKRIVQKMKQFKEECEDGTKDI